MNPAAPVHESSLHQSTSRQDAKTPRGFEQEIMDSSIREGSDGLS